MLVKINELNRNAITLLSVGIIALTAVIITLIATIEPSGSADPLTDLETFQKHFKEEYGVKPSISLVVLPDASKSQTEILTKEISNDLELGDVEEDDTLSGWFNAEDKDKDIAITVVTKYDKK